MDFIEYMIKRRKSAAEIVLSIFIYFGATILAIFCFFTFAQVFAPLSTLLVAACYYIAYRIAASLNKEYEYICTQDNVAIDVILNKARRKRLISFSVTDVEIIAPIEDSSYANKLSGYSFSKTINATSRSNHSTVYFAIIPGEKPILVKFEPTHTILTALYKYAPSKIIIQD